LIGVKQETFLLLHVYPAILLVLGLLYGVSVFKIRRNYNEGRWVLCATLLTVPVFITAGLVYYFAPDQYQVAYPAGVMWSLALFDPLYGCKQSHATFSATTI
jgi:hypothetical protein